MSPELADERRHNLYDPVESDESDVDEGDTVLDHAPNWANGVEADARDGLRQRGIAGGEKKNKKKGKKGAVKEEEGRSNAPLVDVGTGGNANANEECKLVLVVRTDLGMTKGTVTSLLFSPSPLTPPPSFISIHKLTRTSLPLPKTGKIAAQCSHATLACYKTISSSASTSTTSRALLQRWERHGQAKIAVQTKSEEELLELMGKARSLGITAEVIQDAGRTQIDPGSLTVLGVGPAPKSLVDAVTGGLKLL